jgi:hypothetical protein
MVRASSAAPAWPISTESGTSPRFIPFPLGAPECSPSTYLLWLPPEDSPLMVYPSKVTPISLRAPPRR